MSVKSWIEETAKEIIGEFEQVLCDNDIKINNRNLEENKFEREDSFINIIDYNKLKGKIVKQLHDLQEYIVYDLDDVA